MGFNDYTEKMFLLPFDQHNQFRKGANLARKFHLSGGMNRRRENLFVVEIEKK